MRLGTQMKTEQLFPKKQLTLVCAKCGSEELSFKVWINKHFQIQASDFITSDTDTWCEDCRDLVRYVANEL